MSPGTGRERAAMRKVISWKREKTVYYMAGTGTLGR
jgi:hypothetical protein